MQPQLRLKTLLSKKRKRLLSTARALLKRHLRPAKGSKVSRDLKICLKAIRGARVIHVDHLEELLEIDLVDVLTTSHGHGFLELAKVLRHLL